MDFYKKLVFILALIVVLPLSVMTSNVSIVDAQNFVSRKKNLQFQQREAQKKKFLPMSLEYLWLSKIQMQIPILLEQIMLTG